MAPVSEGVMRVTVVAAERSLVVVGELHAVNPTRTRTATSGPE